MKIIHVGKYYLPFYGGIENFMAGLMSEQAKQGHQVQTIVHQHRRKQKFVSEKFGDATVHRTPTHGNLLFVPIAPSFGKYLKQVVDEFKPDVIHLHMPNVSCFWALFSKKLRKIPWVIHWHSDVVGAAPDWRIKLLYPFYRLFEKALLSSAKKVIATSEPYLETSKPLVDFIDKCEVVELGIEDRKLKALLNEKENEELKLLCIGRLTYYKGHEVLIKALSKARRQGIDLSIVGTGELEDSLKSLVDNLELEEKVHFLGSLSDELLEQELKGCDLLCLPSLERTEAFGVVLLEAMRASKPCLVTNVDGSGMSWVVQGEETGFVVQAGDVDALANKLSEIYDNKGVLKKLGENGRRRFESEFTIEKIAAKINDIYEEVISSSTD
jgi:rhamnosyl/mannosyltransferase